MDDRKQQILRAIVQEYVSRAEPVSSKNISGKYGLDVSPATVRNEMAALEKMGLIEQPHTSAGRVPSESGYRYYVDYLMEKYRLAMQEENLIREQMDPRAAEVDRLLTRAGELLSQLTSYPTLVSEPQMRDRTYKQVKMVRLDESRALLVVLLSDGDIRNYQVNLVGPVEDGEMERISNLLTEKLKGIPVNTVEGTLTEMMAGQNVVSAEILEDVLKVLAEEMRDGETSTVHIAGTLNIFNQPEFKDMEKIRSLLAFFEHQKALKTLIDSGQEGISIKIGEEVALENIAELSVITSTYCINGKPVGTIGVLGPTRMTYSRTSTMLEKVAEGLGISLIRLMY